MTETMPKRIQRRRTKGWRMPENTVSVCRPGPFGNPYIVGEDGPVEHCVWLYRLKMEEYLEMQPRYLDFLRGKDLACWCPEDAEHCHGDVLLDLANR